MISRYKVPALEKIFSEEAKYKRWLLIEKEVLFALADTLNLSAEELNQFSNELPSISPAEVEQVELQTKHDFVAFLRVLEEKTKHLSLSKWIHYGLTSSDVIDTANSLALREANHLLSREIEKLHTTLYSLSYKYLNTLQVGRTHGRHAEPTSFGYKFAIAYQELESAFELLHFSRRKIEVISIKGSTGTYAHIGPEIQEKLARRLQLFSLYCSTQALPRARYSSYLYSLSLIGQILNSLAVNLRTLSREEINEIFIESEKDQVGSSSMPHKSNPVLLENVSGLSRWLTKLSELSQDNIPLWDERDISHSSNERMSLVDAPILLFNIVSKMNSILQSLRPNESQLSKNLSLTKGLISSQSAMLSLLKSPSIKSRSEAHKLISELSSKVSSGEYSSFEEALKQSSIIPSEEIDKVLNLPRHLSHLPKVYHQIFKNEIENKYCDSQVFSKHDIDNSIHLLAQRINWYYMQEPWMEKETLTREEMVDSKYQNNAVLVISLLEGSTPFTGFIIPLLNFPLICVSIHYSFSGLTDKLRKMKASDSITPEEISAFVEDQISKTSEYQKILELSANYPRVLILEDIVDSKVTLKAVYRMLSKVDNIKEIKSAALFVKIVDREVDPLYREEYYPPSMFSPDYIGSQTEEKLTHFNFKLWNEQSNTKLINWYGLIIPENVWVIGYGLDSNQKYRNFHSLGEVNKAYT